MRNSHPFIFMLLALGWLASLVACQRCPLERYCFYGPAYMPPPSGATSSTFGMELVVYSQVSTVTVTVQIHSETATSVSVSPTAPYRRSLAFLTAALAADTTESRWFYVVSPDPDVIVEHRSVKGSTTAAAVIRHHLVALGRRFRIPWETGAATLAVSIMAPEDGTRVTIVHPTVGSANITITLNSWNSYVATSSSLSALRSGTLISSNKPISVCSGARESGMDRWEMLMPTAVYGTEFFVPRYTMNDVQGQRTVIGADVDAVDVTEVGVFKGSIQSANSVYSSTADGVIIRTSKPAHAVNRWTSKSGSASTASTETAQLLPLYFPRSTEQRSMFITVGSCPGCVPNAEVGIVIESSRISSVKVDGSQIVLSAVLNTSNVLSFGSKTLTPGTHTIAWTGDAHLLLFTMSTTGNFYSVYSPYRVPSCGDGIVQSSESCDDGNISDFDGCSSSCKIDGTAKSYFCSSDTDCVPHAVCNSQRLCAYTCSSTSDCPSGSSCDSGVCSSRLVNVINSSLTVSPISATTFFYDILLDTPVVVRNMTALLSATVTISRTFAPSSTVNAYFSYLSGNGSTSLRFQWIGESIIGSYNLSVRATDVISLLSSVPAVVSDFDRNAVNATSLGSSIVDKFMSRFVQPQLTSCRLLSSDALYLRSFTLSMQFSLNVPCIYFGYVQAQIAGRSDLLATSAVTTQYTVQVDLVVANGTVWTPGSVVIHNLTVFGAHAPIRNEQNVSLVLPATIACNFSSVLAINGSAIPWKIVNSSVSISSSDVVVQLHFDVLVYNKSEVKLLLLAHSLSVLAAMDSTTAAFLSPSWVTDCSAGCLKASLLFPWVGIPSCGLFTLSLNSSMVSLALASFVDIVGNPLELSASVGVIARLTLSCSPLTVTAVSWSTTKQFLFSETVVVSVNLSKAVFVSDPAGLASSAYLYLQSRLFRLVSTYLSQTAQLQFSYNVSINDTLLPSRAFPTAIALSIHEGVFVDFANVSEPLVNSSMVQLLEPCVDSGLFSVMDVSISPYSDAFVFCYKEIVTINVTLSRSVLVFPGTLFSLDSAQLHAPVVSGNETNVVQFAGTVNALSHFSGALSDDIVNFSTPFVGSCGLELTRLRSGAGASTKLTVVGNGVRILSAHFRNVDVESSSFEVAISTAQSIKLKGLNLPLIPGIAIVADNSLVPEMTSVSLSNAQSMVLRFNFSRSSAAVQLTNVSCWFNATLFSISYSAFFETLDAVVSNITFVVTSPTLFVGYFSVNVSSLYCLRVTNISLASVERHNPSNMPLALGLILGLAADSGGTLSALSLMSLVGSVSISNMSLTSDVAIDSGGVRMALPFPHVGTNVTVLVTLNASSVCDYLLAYAQLQNFIFNVVDCVIMLSVWNASIEIPSIDESRAALHQISVSNVSLDPSGIPRLVYLSFVFSRHVMNVDAVWPAFLNFSVPEPSRWAAVPVQVLSTDCVSNSSLRGTCTVNGSATIPFLGQNTTVQATIALAAAWNSFTSVVDSVFGRALNASITTATIEDFLFSCDVPYVPPIITAVSLTPKYPTQDACGPGLHVASLNDTLRVIISTASAAKLQYCPNGSPSIVLKVRCSEHVITLLPTSPVSISQSTQVQFDARFNISSTNSAMFCEAGDVTLVSVLLLSGCLTDMDNVSFPLESGPFASELRIEGTSSSLLSFKMVRLSTSTADADYLEPHGEQDSFILGDDIAVLLHWTRNLTVSPHTLLAFHGFLSTGATVTKHFAVLRGSGTRELLFSALLEPQDVFLSQMTGFSVSLASGTVCTSNFVSALSSVTMSRTTSMSLIAHGTSSFAGTGILKPLAELSPLAVSTEAVGVRWFDVTSPDITLSLVHGFSFSIDTSWPVSLSSSTTDLGISVFVWSPRLVLHPVSVYPEGLTNQTWTFVFANIPHRDLVIPAALLVVDPMRLMQELGGSSANKRFIDRVHLEQQVLPVIVKELSIDTLEPYVSAATGSLTDTAFVMQLDLNEEVDIPLSSSPSLLSLMSVGTSLSTAGPQIQVTLSGSSTMIYNATSINVTTSNGNSAIVMSFFIPDMSSSIAARAGATFTLFSAGYGLLLSGITDTAGNPVNMTRSMSTLSSFTYPPPLPPSPSPSTTSSSDSSNFDTDIIPFIVLIVCTVLCAIALLLLIGWFLIRLRSRRRWKRLNSTFDAVSPAKAVAADDDAAVKNPLKPIAIQVAPMQSVVLQAPVKLIPEKSVQPIALIPPPQNPLSVEYEVRFLCVRDGAPPITLSNEVLDSLVTDGALNVICIDIEHLNHLLMTHVHLALASHLNTKCTVVEHQPMALVRHALFLTLLQQVCDPNILLDIYFSATVSPHTTSVLRPTLAVLAKHLSEALQRNQQSGPVVCTIPGHPIVRIECSSSYARCMMNCIDVVLQRSLANEHQQEAIHIAAAGFTFQATALEGMGSSPLTISKDQATSRVSDYLKCGHFGNALDPNPSKRHPNPFVFSSTNSEDMDAVDSSWEGHEVPVRASGVLYGSSQKLLAHGMDVLAQKCRMVELQSADVWSRLHAGGGTSLIVGKKKRDPHGKWRHIWQSIAAKLPRTSRQLHAVGRHVVLVEHDRQSGSDNVSTLIDDPYVATHFQELTAE